ncbi:hypothetical protein OAE88_00500 [bacterium]|nr:hypothetical protein [bacterium]
MEILAPQKTLKGILFNTLDLILDGSATPEMVEQVCYVSEQMIKDDKNTIETEKARMYMEIERQERMTSATEKILSLADDMTGTEDECD